MDLRSEGIATFHDSCLEGKGRGKEARDSMNSSGSQLFRGTKAAFVSIRSLVKPWRRQAAGTLASPCLSKL